MLRRILLFVVFIVLVAAVSSLVYFNSQDIGFRLGPGLDYTLPLGMLMLAAALAGAAVSFLFALMREGRHAIREWRVQRELRHAERTAEYKASARSLLLAGEYERARALLTKATQSKPPDASDVVDYAETFLRSSDPEGARRALEEGQKDFGNDPLLLHALARALLAMGDHKAAIETLERAVSHCETSTVLLRMLRDLLFAQEQWERAAEIQQRLVDRQPQDAAERNRLLGARFEAAMQLNGNGRGEALQRLTGEEPEFVPAVTARAEALAAEGQLKKAIRLLEKSVKRRPHSAVLDTLERLTPAELQPRLVKFYQKAVNRHASNELLKLRAARVMTDAGKLAEADRLLQEVTESRAPAATAALRALIEEQREHGELAQREARKALEAAELSKPEPKCTACGVPSKAWQTRCPACGVWGSIDAF